MFNNFVIDLYLNNNKLMLVISTIAMLVIGLIDFIYRLYLSKAVGYYLEVKKIENSKMWRILTFIFGLLAVAICWLINRNIGEKDISADCKKFFKKLVTVAIIFGVISVPCDLAFDSFSNIRNLENDKKQISYQHQAYFDEDMQNYYCYDKNGNAYSSVTLDDFRYYDADGNYYVRDDDYNFYCEENEKVIKYENSYIDANGFLAEKKNLKSVEVVDEIYGEGTVPYYLDKNNNIYYSISGCSWDKNGNLILKDWIANNIK